MTYTVDVTITNKAEGGDTIVSGTGTISPGNVTVTSGGRLTAAQKRAGKTLQSVEDDVAGNIGRLAIAAARVANA